MKRVLLFLVLYHITIVAQSINVVFLGILPGGAPDFEKRFTTLLREQVTVLSNVAIADYDDTEYFKTKTNFTDSPVLSRSFVEKLMNVSNDNTLVVWGAITKVVIKPVRRWLFGAQAVGTLTLSLTLYSLDFGEYAYIGEVSCKASIPKPPVFFGNVEKETHITAFDRSVIIEKLQDQAAGKSIDIIHGIIKSQMVKTGTIRPDDVEVKKVPSVSDLFDIPTVEAPDVGEEEPQKEEKTRPQEPEVEKKTEEPVETETEEEAEEEEEKKEPEPSEKSEE